jgi:hypothetical protein
MARQLKFTHGSKYAFFSGLHTVAMSVCQPSHRREAERYRPHVGSIGLDKLTARRERRPIGNPFFNHWIETIPSSLSVQAEDVNA